MKVHPHVKRTAWASAMFVSVLGLIAAINGMLDPYSRGEIITVLLIMHVLLLVSSILLVPEPPQVREKVVYKYADERAPEGFDTQS